MGGISTGESWNESSSSKLLSILELSDTKVEPQIRNKSTEKEMVTWASCLQTSLSLSLFLSSLKLSDPVVYESHDGPESALTTPSNVI